MTTRENFVCRTATNGIRVYENRVEHNAHLPITLVSGTCMSILSMMLTVCQMLGIKAFAIELRYHGEGQDVEALKKLGKMRVEDNARDVAFVIDEMIGPCILAGWSMGGLISLITAHKCFNVIRLALLASAPPAWTLLPFATTKKLIHLRYILPAIFRTPFTFEQDGVKAMMLNYGFSPEKQNEVVKKLCPDSGTYLREIVGQTVRAPNALSCNLIIFAAERDILAPLSVQMKIRDLYPGAICVKIPGACHGFPLQEQHCRFVLCKILDWSTNGRTHHVPCLEQVA